MLDPDEKFIAKIVEYFTAWEYFLLKPAWSYWLFGAFNKHVAAVYVSYRLNTTTTTATSN